MKIQVLAAAALVVAAQTAVANPVEDILQNLSGLSGPAAGGVDGNPLTGGLSGLMADSPLGDILVVEPRDNGLHLGLRLDGSELIHPDIQPLLTLDADLTTDGLSSDVYVEESDDWTSAFLRLTGERQVIGIEGYGDETIDSDRDFLGLLN